MHDVLNLFPINGLDRSLHAPVFVGLLFITFFAETLGWTYAGLVVPGYFAAVFIAAPATAGLVLVETLATYGISILIGKWLPKTRAWSTAFGRERFFLLVVVSLAVRLAIEANLLPYLSRHYVIPYDRELHSLGLVLVPLLANMFWNAGLLRSAPRVALLTALTYFVVDGLLLRYTNFTISRFEVANESVSLSFLEAPHAQLILVIGALLAARANVLYGWDYNGILVPALLSVAWYQPIKLVTTLVEALVVYGLARALAATPLFSRALIVGTRRVLMVFSIGFFLKWAGGFIALQFAPDVHMVDYLGFGYLLPTLLAVKMWNRNTIGPILVPTVQVSLVAFIVGNALGYGMAYLDRPTQLAENTTRIPMDSHSAAMALMLADAAPEPNAEVAAQLDLSRIALTLVQSIYSSETVSPELNALARKRRLSLHDHRDYFTLTATSTGPDSDITAPRLAIHKKAKQRAPWLILAQTTQVGSPLIPVAEAIANQLEARAFSLQSQRTSTIAFDELFNEHLLEALEIEHVLIIERGGNDAFSVSGSIPDGLDISQISSVLGTPLKLAFAGSQQAGGITQNVVRLALTPEAAMNAAALHFGAPETVVMSEPMAAIFRDRVKALTEVTPGHFSRPSIAELRLFRNNVSPAFRELHSSSQTTPWQRALAHRLNYRIGRVENADHDTATWLLYEPVGPHRGGQATWIRRTSSLGAASTPVLIETPAIRWESGTLKAGQMVAQAVRADGLLLPGSLPSADVDGASDMRRASGVRSYYHVIHQSWVDNGGAAIVLHGISAEHEGAHQAVLSNGSEAATLSALPQWTRPLQDFLSGNGLPLDVFDGSAELSPFEGSADPALGYARRFAPDSTLLLWLSPSLRKRLLGIQEDGATLRRLANLGSLPTKTALIDRIRDLDECGKAPVDAAKTRNCPTSRRSASCDLARRVTLLELYANTRNPHALRHAIKDSDCHVEIIEDSESGLLWALSTGAHQLCAVPLLGGPVKRIAAPTNAAGLAAVTSTGLSSLCLEGTF